MGSRSEERNFEVIEVRLWHGTRWAKTEVAISEGANEVYFVPQIEGEGLGGGGL